MSVDNSRVIDFIGVDKETGEVVLTISDHLDWLDSIGHLALLQSKLNSYLAFVESGELLQQYTDAKGRLVAFHIHFRFAPDTHGKLFLERAKSVIENAGFTLTYKVSPFVA